LRRDGDDVKVTLAIVTLAIAAFFVYRALAPRAFVSAGRGAISAEVLAVERVTAQDSVAAYKDQRVNADLGKKFVSIEIRIAASPTEFDVDDFQLVKAKTAEVGSEENLGDNSQDNYFFWTPLDASGQPAASLDPKSEESRVRLSFQVPKEATEGFLFYWGVYVGPLQFAG
jgi:hypothetical protein